MNGYISHGSEYYLCIRVDAYFYGWCNANSDFWIWSEEMVQLKSLCLVLSGSVNSKAALLAKYFILANNCSWSHTNVGQTGGDLSYRVPYLFQIHWPHGVFHQKMRSRTSSFCVAFGSLGFFLTSTFPALKHHQPCILLQSASQLQLSICAFGKTKLQKLLVCVFGVEASFYGWCNANPDFWIWSE